MATLNVDVTASKGSIRLLDAAARAGRIATLRELAADLNARADVLEAVNSLAEDPQVNVHAHLDGTFLAEQARREIHKNNEALTRAISEQPG